MNRGGAAPVTEADPLLLPKWRFEPGKNADEAAFVLRALGLVPDANNAACDGRKHWTWIPPPGPASNGARDGEEALDDDPGPVAFDVASRDEALALEREGPDAERERIWLSSATLVILPPVLISHWLEQIQFALAGDEEEAGFLRRGDAPPRVCVAGAGDAKKGAGGANNAPFMMSLNDDAREDRFDRFDEDSDSDPVGGRGGGCSASRSRRPSPSVVARRASRRDDRRAAAFTPEEGTSIIPKAEKIGARRPRFSRGRLPATLASAWDIVLMPANRLSSEFSPADSLFFACTGERVVLDEGHQLGGASAITAKLSMACALRAARAVGHDRDADAGDAQGRGGRPPPAPPRVPPPAPVRGEPGAVEPRDSKAARGSPRAELRRSSGGGDEEGRRRRARVEEEEEGGRGGRFRSSDRRVVRG